ncbi:hypothetical protein OtV6_074 [Ostreococcus tauri virus RT-2011]|nr:hypothetical protein OtV6_074 [Ostreococcus tauri virus RT-2011]
MAATNVQAFSGDVEISSNLTAASSKFSLDTNGTLKQFGAGTNNNYIKLMKYFASGSNWKIATGSYTGVTTYQWLSIRAKMTRLDVDVKTIQFNYIGNAGISRVRDSIVIGGGGSATQPNEIKVYNKESNSTYEIYLQIDSATSVEVEITHRNSTIDDDYSTLATANNGAIDETGLTKIYDSGTTTDLRLRSGNVGIGTTIPQDVTHIWKNGANDAYGLLIEQNNAGTGSATLKFSVAHTSESTAGLSKAGIFFRRANTNGRGDLLFCMDNADDTNDVDTSNHALTIYRDGNVGIGVTNPRARLDVRGDGMIFDKAEGDGTILEGLYNWADTQSLLIDRGVQGNAGTVTASTTYDPPPGTAGDVICAFQNNSGGEAVTNPFYPSSLTGSTGDVFVFGVWGLATENVNAEFFMNPGGIGSDSSAFTIYGDGTWRFYQVSRTLSTGSGVTMFFRIDNNSTGRLVYLTGASIRKNPTSGVTLPFTRRFSPQDSIGSVTAARNIIAKDVCAQEITSPDINVVYTGSIKFQRSDGDGFGTAHKISVDSGKTKFNAGSGGGGDHGFRLNSDSNEFAQISRVNGFYHRSAYSNGRVAKFIRHSGLHTSQVHILALYSNAPNTDVENLDDEALKAHWTTGGNYVQVGSYAGKSSGTTWAETSDERIKTDIEDADLELCAENVRNIPFRRYRLRDEYIKTHEAPDRTKLGWIAQEVQPVFPKAVITNEEEQYGLSNVMSLDSDQLFKTAYGAVKYLLNEVTTLKERITVLENNT